MSVVRRATAAVIALALVALLALLSGVPYAAESAHRAIIRLSWRARGERAQHCRPPSEQELQKLPAHMRPQEICERGIVPYRLRVRIDDSLARDMLVRAGGAQGDRPLFVFSELPVTPGTHRLSIVFEREDSDHKNAVNQDEEFDNREQRDLRETPRLLTLDETITLSARAIAVITYDEERRRLALLAARDSGR